MSDGTTQKRGPFRVGQVAEMLGTHRDTVQRWCRERLIDVQVTRGGHYRISATALDAFVNEQRDSLRRAA